MAISNMARERAGRDMMMDTRRLRTLALTLATASMTVLAGQASAQVTGGGLAAPGDANIPNAQITGTATYNAATLLWTYRYELTNVLALTDSYHLYIYEDPTHAGVHHEGNYASSAGVGNWGTENTSAGPGRPGFIFGVNHYYHAGTMAGFANYTMSFTDPDGPVFQSWALSSNSFGHYPIRGGAASVPVPGVPAPASAAVIAAGVLIARRRRR